MVQLGELEASSRLQRFLWTNEYVGLEDSIVTVESVFVLEDSLGKALRMVRGGLCSRIFVLADCASRCKTSREECYPIKTPNSRLDFLTCENEGLDNMELLWLLPLDNIHLTVSKKASRHGLRVLRLRFCSGQLYHLELAESKRNSKVWMVWVQALEKLRKHPRYLFREDGHTASATNSHRPCNHGESHHSRISIESIKRQRSSTLIDGRGEIADERKPSQPAPRDQTLAMHLVDHFTDHLRHATDTPVSEMNYDGDASLRPTKPSAIDICVERATSNGNVPTSATSSRRTTESEGSTFSNIPVDDFLRHLDMTSLYRICLCVGDYFGQFMFEAGTSGLPKRMASLSAIGHFIEVENCNMDSDDIHFGFGIDRDSLRHCSSLPSILDGEASFVEDLKQVDEVTHRTSLAYLDLTNENDEKQAHVINGHVMLITGEEYELYKEVIRHRKSPIDLRFGTARHPDVVRKKAKLQDALRVRRNGIAKITDEVQSKIKHLTQKYHHMRQERDESVTSEKEEENGSHSSSILIMNRSKRVTKRLRSIFQRSKKSRRPAKVVHSPTEHAHVYEYITEIDIDDVANELTVIDAELFLRIHESELIGCAWLREERHSKAPNVMACIDFFHRLFGIVVTEVLLPILPRERAELLARFSRIADRCLNQKNFHSVKAIVNAVQSPALQRLQNTWGCFERMYPESFKLWQKLYHIMSDEAPSGVYLQSLQQAVSCPPCLPFLGTFLRQVTEFYMVKTNRRSDRGKSSQDSSQASQRTGTTSWASQLSHTTSQMSTPSSIDELSSFSFSKESLLKSLTTNSTNHENGRNAPRNGSRGNLLGKLISSSFNINQRVKSFFEKESTTSFGKPESFVTVSSGSATDYCDATSNSSCLLEQGRLSSCMTTARRRHIQRLIIEYAKRLAEERGMTWNGARVGQQTNNWDYIFDQALEWSKLFKRVSSGKDSQENILVHNFSDLKLIAEEIGTHGPSLEGIKSEYDLTRTLFYFQLCAVRFKHETKEDVRDFLLKAHYNSDVDNFALSLRREPPNF